MSVTISYEKLIIPDKWLPFVLILFLKLFIASCESDVLTLQYPKFSLFMYLFICKHIQHTVVTQNFSMPITEDLGFSFGRSIRSWRQIITKLGKNDGHSIKFSYVCF